MKRNNLITISLILLALVPQGLYYSYQWLAFSLLLCCLLMVTITRESRLKIPKDPVLFFLCGFLVLQGLGYIWSLEKGMLVFGLLRYSLYLIFYLLICQPSAKDMRDRLIPWYIFLMALSGLVSLGFYMTGLFEGLYYVFNGRVSGPVQYANTYAVLLAVALYLLIPMSMTWWKKFVGYCLLVVPLILTYSRAGLLMAGVVLIILLAVVTVDRATFFHLTCVYRYRYCGIDDF